MMDASFYLGITLIAASVVSGYFVHEIMVRRKLFPSSQRDLAVLGLAANMCFFCFIFGILAIL